MAQYVDDSKTSRADEEVQQMHDPGKCMHPPPLALGLVLQEEVQRGLLGDGVIGALGVDEDEPVAVDEFLLNLASSVNSGSSWKSTKSSRIAALLTQSLLPAIEGPAENPEGLSGCFEPAPAPKAQDLQSSLGVFGGHSQR